MPAPQESKSRPHPRDADPRPAPSADPATPPYAELAVMSNFSFLRGASHPDELVQSAAELGYRAIALADVNSLAGVVRAHVAAKQAGVQLVVGCRLELLADQQHPAMTVLVYPTDRPSYGRLCRLLTLGKRRAAKGCCHLGVGDLLEHHAGLLAVVLPTTLNQLFDPAWVAGLSALAAGFDDDRLSLAVACRFDGLDTQRLLATGDVARRCAVPLVAVNDVLYHVAARRPLQDVLTCIRLGCTLDQAGFALQANAERHLKTPACLARLFSRVPQAVARSVQVARRAAGFALDQVRYEYPAEICPPGKSAMQHLTDLAWQGAAERYPGGPSADLRRRIEHELQLIAELNYAPYFLTVHDLVLFARSRGILCQGRGAAANSAVCYCLGVTAVDPARVDLLFERFISRERNEPPDIDIDFEHERREEVIQYLYAKYGRDRAGLTAEVISYRGRSAVRDVGKAVGLSLDAVDRLAKSLDWWDADLLQPSELARLGFNPADPLLRRTVTLCQELIGFPRHLSQHVGGFVITAGPLSELVPIENAAMAERTVIEWDKDDIDALGMLKIDVLALGMLTCIRKALALVNAARPGQEPLALHTIPPEDPAVYDMLCKADSVGVFQVESRAQMTMLPRLKPRCYYDLVIEVAIVRPGPIQGRMVHPYLRRRNGEEPVTYPDERIRAVLGRTLGVPLFQEQAMKLAVVAAGFTPGEADQLRRAMAAWKRSGHLIVHFGQKIIAGMLANGYDRAYAQRCFDQIKGFGEYGFPESHAASFALLVYVSAWLKRHHPAAFACALLNSQPMGFYQPAQIVADARAHGVVVRPVDVNHSRWDCTLEPAGDGAGPALRLGMRQVHGLGQTAAEAVVAAVQRRGPARSLHALWRDSQVRIAALRALAAGDAFGSLGLTRQQAWWAIRGLRDDRLPLFDGLEPDEPAGGLPAISGQRQVEQDYAALSLSLKAHPISFLRPRLEHEGVTPAGWLKDPARCPNGAAVTVAGLVFVRQRPATAAGLIFMTAEDETGIANLVLRPAVYQRDKARALHSVLVIAAGQVERQGEVVHVMVRRFLPAEHLSGALETPSRDFH